jgi:hypothetical protein
MRFIQLGLLALLVACSANENPPLSNDKPEEMKEINASRPTLYQEDANKLARLPFDCIQNEYPNKLGQTLGSEEDLGSPRSLHPAFYGCFDWHSAVHGHWSLVRLLKAAPDLNNGILTMRRLMENIDAANIEKEVAYFKGVHSTSYERTYGWAWLLKLAEELTTWDRPEANFMKENLKPLTELIVSRYLEFLPKLNYPIRVGEHTNTAFGLTFAWDYANTVGDTTLKSLIESRARDFYMEDRACPLDWEPSGFDFLSPCLEEIDIMRRVLEEEAFLTWLDAFLPQLKDPGFVLEVGLVSDRKDGKLVHLDGLNFSRAWCLLGLANQYPAYKHLEKIAYQHINYSLPNLVEDSYEGGHWLGSFALFALQSME